MVLNAAVQMLREAEELKQDILKFKGDISMLKDRCIWVIQQKLQKIYQKVLVLDLDYALDKKVEQDLWNFGFKQQIEALQAISKDRKSPHRSEGQHILVWVLQAAAGFYLCLLHQICTAFKLDLPFRRRASLLGWVEEWGVPVHEPTGTAWNPLPPPSAARYICQHCLVHLGDLARYRQQLRVAHTFYRHALLVSAHSGQPYNQLALVAWRRGNHLSALYWHVRSFLVRAPFPPAPANLARTLAAAARSRDLDKDLPVLPGITPTLAEVTPAPAPLSTRLDPHSYLEELMKVLHLLHTLEDLDTASQLVETLNASLTPLVATDSFEDMTLVKMVCVLIWMVHATTESLQLEAAQQTQAEAAASGQARQLVCGALLALLLPSYTRDNAQPSPALPALKVLLPWVLSYPQLLESAAMTSRPQIWAALAYTLNALAEYSAGFDNNLFASVPLPEDEELHGFLPLEQAFTGLKFTNFASWETYGDRIPDYNVEADGDGDLKDEVTLTPNRSPADVSEHTLRKQPELEHKLRAHRLVLLGEQFAAMVQKAGHDHFTVSKEEDVWVFSASCVDGEQLCAALAELAPQTLSASTAVPVVISEADFREKVREKRVGILKPQGSLERSREERAMATTQEEQQEVDGEDDSDKGDDAKKELRKPRMNVAMAAIMRKQEETNKQVKFMTPATTPDSNIEPAAVSPVKEEKPKIIQPKAIKSLDNLPIGRKTGGILSLKDKSAGYPHLVNADPEPEKKSEKDDKKHDIKVINTSSQLSQQSSYNTPNPRSELHPSSPNWTNNMPNSYNNNARITFQPKTTYGIQNSGINFNPTYQQQAVGMNNQGIRLPVVNPKEIDVRTAAMQKQNSGQELFQDGPKFNYQMSGDKKNFLNDLPPRFANQYRYWQQNAQSDNQFNTSQDNKFRDDNYKTPNNFANNSYGANIQQPNTRPNWMMNPPPIGQENYPQQQVSWWKPESAPPSYNTNFPAPNNIQTHFYSPHLTNPYSNMATFNPALGTQNKSDSLNSIPTNYMPSTIGQPQLPNLQNLMSSSNYTPPLNNFGTYGQTVGYDSNMYPHFSNNKLGYMPQMKMPEKPIGQYPQGNELTPGMGYSGGMQHRSIGHTFNDTTNNDRSALKTDKILMPENSVNEGQGSTYSLFSGAQESPGWSTSHIQPQQSLWLGASPSPLERLLEQQKQIKQAPSEPL